MEAKVINKINNILEKNEKSITVQYTEIFNKTIEHYGKNIVVLIEVGSFYEMYCPFEKGLLYNYIVDISKITDMQLTRKNTKIAEINEKNPYLLGFNTASKDKYIKKIINTNKYNILIIKQTGNAKEKNVKRQVEKILSVGTNIEHTKEENYILQLDIEKIDNLYNVGLSYVDLSIGKIFTNEYYSTKEDNTKALDMIIDTIMQFNISQININLEKEIEESFITNYLELKDKYHITKEKRKLEYQNTLLQKIYNVDSFVTPIEAFDLSRLPLATNSLIYLLEHIIDYEKELLDNLDNPQIINNENILYLGNTTIEQLNIISSDNSTTLLDILNNCTTTFGKRFLKERIFYPISDKKELERRYNLTEKLFEKKYEIKKDLNNIYDLEKIKRKIAINKLHPFEIYQLYISLKTISKNDLFISENIRLSEIKDILFLLEKTFILEDCSRYNIESINKNLLKEKINSFLDNCVKTVNTTKNILEDFVETISTFYKTKDFITLQYNEKDGFYFTMTKTRYKLLEKDIDERYFKLNNKNIFMNEFTYKKMTSNIKLYHPTIKKMSEEYLVNLNYIISINKDFFQKELYKLLSKSLKILNELIIHISDIDIAICNGINSELNNYVKPTIVETNKQKIEAIELRHPIIEKILVNTKFIPNDIVLGEIDNKEIKKRYNIQTNEVNGILLFGINSSGKSSLQKALGLNIIMAQAGLYVSAKSFTFTLYEKLFTRILAKDNSDRGLSTFAVEMLELKNILQRGDTKTLVLGDEICHGTETTSGVSIVAATIKYLCEKNINFMFATHLHQIVEIPEINRLKNLINLHLSIERKDGVLIYNRKLKSGSGSSVYGLEFAKSLNMNKQFLKYSDYFLQTIDKKTQSELNKITKAKKNKYNNKMYDHKCIFCDELSIDYHHITEQKEADENNKIDGLHKNHLSNLLPLCKKHHKKMHDFMKDNDIEGEDLIKYVMTSKGVKTIIHHDLKEYMERN